MEEQEDRWSDLAPELLENVVTRVEQMKREGRRVVAMAGVCRSWRRHILGRMNKSSNGTGHGSVVMQFPWMLLAPGPCAPQPPIQCLIKRRGSHFLLFQTPNKDDLNEMHFLLGARRRRLPSGFSYVIGKDLASLTDKLAVDVLGKVKSNFWATEFVLWEKRESESDSIPVVSLTFVEHLVHGIRQRRMHGALQQACNRWGGGLQFVLEKRRRKGEGSLVPAFLKPWFACTCSSYASCKGGGNTTSRNIPSSRMTAAANTGHSAPPGSTSREAESCGVVQSVVQGMVDEEKGDDTDVELKSKVPAWDAQQQCWSLDFKGRATMPSMHNFQLIRAEADANVDNIILQLGKIGKNVYNMDYCSPLSAFQAFSICLSSFATSAALEP